MAVINLNVRRNEEEEEAKGHKETEHMKVLKVDLGNSMTVVVVLSFYYGGWQL